MQRIRIQNTKEKETQNNTRLYERTSSAPTDLQITQPPGSNSGALTTLFNLRIICLDSPDAFLPEQSLSLQCRQCQSSGGRHCKPKQAAQILKCINNNKVQ